MSHFVHCRVCKKRFDAKEGEIGIFWIMPSHNWYYHLKCYNDWKGSADQTDSGWESMIYDLISRELKGSYSWGMIRAQLKKLIAQRMTYKGIYYTLYWHFMIKNNKWKEEFGIGIVASIYEQATAYWAERESKKSGILEQIERIAREKLEENPIIIGASPSKRKSKIKAPE